MIALIIPTAFAYALETAVGPDAENDVILEMSRGSSVILIFMCVTFLFFRDESHSNTLSNSYITYSKREFGFPMLGSHWYPLTKQWSSSCIVTLTSACRVGFS